jgi:hypothetical protein
VNGGAACRGSERREGSKGRGVATALRVVRVVAVLVVLFGIGAAGSSFESSTNRKGIDTGVFGGGVLALLGLRGPEDGDMFPVWIGRLCVVAGVAVVTAITLWFRRARSLGYTDGLPPVPDAGSPASERGHAVGHAGGPTLPPASSTADDALQNPPDV